MSDINDVAFFFNRKASEWTATGLSVEQYIKRQGKERLADEFRSDPYFLVVCEFANRVSTLQLRSSIWKGFEEAAGLLFGVPLVGATDILVGAVELACGHNVRGERLLKGGTAIAGLFILGALLSPKKK